MFIQLTAIHENKEQKMFFNINKLLAFGSNENKTYIFMQGDDNKIRVKEDDTQIYNMIQYEMQQAAQLNKQ